MTGSVGLLLSSGGGTTTTATATTTAAKTSASSEFFFYYFAYGSNLLTERIHVQVKGAQFESTGYLGNFELSFFDYGSRWKGAPASIEQKNGSHVWGCVWRVPESFAAELDRQESGYHRLDIDVFMPGSMRSVTCRTYQLSNPHRQRQAPSPHYKHVIVSGAIENNLPNEYVDWLKAIPDNGYRGSVDLDLHVLKELNERAFREEHGGEGA